MVNHKRLSCGFPFSTIEWTLSGLFPDVTDDPTNHIVNIQRSTETEPVRVPRPRITVGGLYAGCRFFTSVPILIIGAVERHSSRLGQ
jgi:hypothetical protein